MSWIGGWDEAQLEDLIDIPLRLIYAPCTLPYASRRAARIDQPL